MKHAVIISTTLATLLLGVVQVASAADAKATYDKSCGMCHNKGMAKAPVHARHYAPAGMRNRLNPPVATY